MVSHGYRHCFIRNDRRHDDLHPFAGRKDGRDDGVFAGNVLARERGGGDSQRHQIFEIERWFVSQVQQPCRSIPTSCGELMTSSVTLGSSRYLRKGAVTLSRTAVFFPARPLFETEAVNGRKVEILGDGNTDILSLILAQHRFDLRVFAVRSLKPHPNGTGGIGCAVSYRFRADRRRIFDQAEQQRGAEPLPEKIVHRPSIPPRPSASVAGEPTSMAIPRGVTARVHSTKSRYWPRLRPP